MKGELIRLTTSTTLLARLIEAPGLVRKIRGLSTQVFSALVRHVGVEDAGELIALATTDQIVAAFDEDLFVNAAPGEREIFDRGRFVVWLEVLLEAGDEAAANRAAELSEDFVVHALSSLVLVLDHEALMTRMSLGGQASLYADKALESAHSEEIDGYLLVSKVHDGWDAVFALILALDSNHRWLLVRLLDRCAAMASEYIDDLDALTTVLSSEDSLAEDVEAERDARRGARGWVEPRAARSFLALASDPEPDLSADPRDPVTHAYFRRLGRRASTAQQTPSHAPVSPDLLEGIGHEGGAPLLALPAADDSQTASPYLPFIEAMRLLRDSAPRSFTERMEELAYLTNVLVAGAQVEGRRLRPAEAAEAALATVAMGAELVAREAQPTETPAAGVTLTAFEVRDVLETSTADRLFRRASGALAAQGNAAFVLSREELKRHSRQQGGG